MENVLPVFRVLKEYEGDLVSSLEDVDLSNLFSEGVKAGIIRQTLENSFEFLYPNVPRPTKIRYLLLHACEQVEDNPRLYERFLEVLAGHGVPSNVLDSMQLNYNNYCADSHVSASALSVAEGISEVLCGSIKDKIGTKRSRYFTLCEKHVSILTEILADHSSKWKEIGISLNLSGNVLKDVQARMYMDSSKISLSEVLREWIVGNNPHAKPPTVGSLEETLGSNTVGLGKEASQLQNNIEKHIQQIEGPSTSAKKMRLDFSSLKKIQSSNILIDRYCFQPEVPEDSWPPVCNKYINLALIKQGNINSAGKYARSTVRGDMDDILRDKDRVEYEEVFSNFEEKCLLLIEGRPGSGKTTLVHRVCRDWAKGEMLKGAKHVFLISLRVFVNKTNPKLEDILNLFYHNNKKAAHEVLEYLHQFNGSNTCFIIDGLDEYSPRGREDSIIFQIICKKYLPLSMVIVASRPVATAKLRRVASKQVEVVGFMREQISSYIKEYPFFDKVKTQKELESYLDLHPNVLHMCYLPVHVAMVSFLFEEMGKDIPQTETGIYKYFTLFTLLRKLSRGDEEIRLRSLDDLPEKYMEYFRKIYELAFTMTVNRKQFLEQDEFSLSDTTGSDEPSLGLVTIDCTAGLYGYCDLYTFLHLTLQEYLAAYHISKLEEEEQAKVISKYGKKKRMRVVWKFYCGLVSFKNSLSNFKEILKSVDNDLFNIQCAFESQQSMTCECVVQSGDGGCITLKRQFLTPSDFTALGYVMTNASSPVEKLVLNGCKFGQEGISALLEESGSKMLSFKTFCFHGRDSVREQYQAVNMLLSKMESLETLDITKTNLGAIKAKDLIFNLTLPHLQTLIIQQSWLNQDSVMGSLEKLIIPCTKFQELQLWKDKEWYPDKLLGQMLFKFPTFLKGITKLDLDLKEVTAQEWKLFSDSLKQHSHYTSLILTNCGIDNDIATVLAECLLQCTSLEDLKLDVNIIGDTGAIALAECLHNCSDLKSFSISFNHIGNTGAIALSKSLKHCISLTELDLRFNKVDIDGAKAILATFEDRKNLNIQIENHRITNQGSIFDIHTLDISKHSISYEQFSIFLSYVQDSKYWENIWIISITEFRISYDGAKALADCLRNCHSLQTLNLAHNEICADGAKALADCLRNSHNLQTLNLALNEIGADGAKALADCLRNSHNLQTLNLAWNKISDDGAKALADCLWNCHSLQTLNLESNKISAYGAKALTDCLKNCRNLQTLNLAKNNILSDGAKALADCLRNCHSLQTLNLELNEISADGAKALADCLRNCHSLQTLNLAWNKISADGAKALADCLWNCHSLQTLNLESNKISAYGAKALTDCLKNCRNLQTLNLAKNNILSDGAKALADCLRNCHSLQTLNLELNEISADGAKALADCLRNSHSLHTLNLAHNEISADGAKALADCLRNSHNLQTLNLALNEIGADGAKALTDCLKNCRNLQTLNLAKNNILSDGAKALADCLRNCHSLHTLNLAHNEISADGAKALADCLRNCHSLHTLNLAHNEISADGAKALADCLRNSHNLQTLNLALNEIGADGAKALADCLRNSHNLQTLNLALNEIGADGAKALTDCLRNSHNLQTLNLALNEIGADGAKALADCLRNIHSLQTLNLEWNEISADGAKALADCLKNCRNLQTLNLAKNNILSDGAKALADCLRNCYSLQTLNLEWNEISDDGAKALADCLRNCHSLQTLNLAWNKISDDGAKALADCLRNCHSLQSLNLKRNEISADGAKALADCLRNCHGLQTLNLESNKISADGAKALADCLRNIHSLQTLNLEWNEISDDGAKALADCLKNCRNLQTLNLAKNNILSDGAKALADCLRNCHSLHTLNLAHNEISADGAKALADCLRNCHSLQTLNLAHNEISADGAKALADCLRNCHSLQTLNLAWNKISDDGAKALTDCLRNCHSLQTLNLKYQMIY